MHRLRRIYMSISPLLTSLAFLITPRLVFADSGETPVSEGLGYLLSAMFGVTGVAIATLSIIVVGLLCLGHYLEWKRLLQTVAGVAIVFGASAIVKGITTLVHNT